MAPPHPGNAPSALAKITCRDGVLLMKVRADLLKESQLLPANDSKNNAAEKASPAPLDQGMKTVAVNSMSPPDIILLGNSILASLKTKAFGQLMQVKKFQANTAAEAYNFVDALNADTRCVCCLFITNEARDTEDPQLTSDNCTRDLRKLSEAILHQCPAAELIIALPPPRGDNYTSSMIQHLINSQITVSMAAKKRIHVLNNDDLGYNGEPDLRFYNRDAIHLNAKGSDYLASKIKTLTNKILSK